jgi:hypothetical protein
MERNSQEIVEKQLTPFPPSLFLQLPGHVKSTRIRGFQISSRKLRIVLRSTIPPFSVARETSYRPDSQPDGCCRAFPKITVASRFRDKRRFRTACRISSGLATKISREP